MIIDIGRNVLRDYALPTECLSNNPRLYTHTYLLDFMAGFPAPTSRSLKLIHTKQHSIADAVLAWRLWLWCHTVDVRVAHLPTLISSSPHLKDFMVCWGGDGGGETVPLSHPIKTRPHTLSYLHQTRVCVCVWKCNQHMRSWDRTRCTLLLNELKICKPNPKSLQNILVYKVIWILIAHVLCALSMFLSGITGRYFLTTTLIVCRTKEFR